MMAEIGEMIPVEDFVHLARPFLAAELLVLEPEGDVFLDERHDDLGVRILEHEPHLSPDRLDVAAGIGSVDPHGSLIGYQQTVEKPREGAFSGAVAADDGDPALVDGQIDTVEHRIIAEAVMDIDDFDHGSAVPANTLIISPPQTSISRALKQTS